MKRTQTYITLALCNEVPGRSYSSLGEGPAPQEGRCWGPPPEGMSAGVKLGRSTLFVGNLESAFAANWEMGMSETSLSRAPLSSRGFRSFSDSVPVLSESKHNSCQSRPCLQSMVSAKGHTRILVRHFPLPESRMRGFLIEDSMIMHVRRSQQTILGQNVVV